MKSNDICQLSRNQRSVFRRNHVLTQNMIFHRLSAMSRNRIRKAWKRWFSYNVNRSIRFQVIVSSESKQWVSPLLEMPFITGNLWVEFEKSIRSLFLSFQFSEFQDRSILTCLISFEAELQLWFLETVYNHWTNPIVIFLLAALVI